MGEFAPLPAPRSWAYGNGSVYCTGREFSVTNVQFRSSGDEGEKMAAEDSKRRRWRRLGVCN
jgi:hypothetical protein